MTNILNEIQQKLKAPKNQNNNFGKYKYRSCEDILEAVKPLLGDNVSLVLEDDIKEVGGRIYVKATAKLYDGSECLITTSAYARESETKKGMDDSQITGTASSYARKYALNGLFAIDDTKDSDTNENKKEVKTKAENHDKYAVNDNFVNRVKATFKDTTVDNLEEKWKKIEINCKDQNDATKDAVIVLYGEKQKELGVR